MVRWYAFRHDVCYCHQNSAATAFKAVDKFNILGVLLRNFGGAIDIFFYYFNGESDMNVMEKRRHDLPSEHNKQQCCYDYLSNVVITITN